MLTEYIVEIPACDVVKMLAHMRAAKFQGSLSSFITETVLDQIEYYYSTPIHNLIFKDKNYAENFCKVQKELEAEGFQVEDFNDPSRYDQGGGYEESEEDIQARIDAFNDSSS